MRSSAFIDLWMLMEPYSDLRRENRRSTVTPSVLRSLSLRVLLGDSELHSEPSTFLAPVVMKELTFFSHPPHVDRLVFTRPFNSESLPERQDAGNRRALGAADPV
ncbi:hypothetical protein Q7C36_023552 [Tachysurus vachellii]|uniref:Uncharacterized protein n=1 Tax=Tachysurus vachellii TaxID=175792 RepID=A0AA88IMK7_TACVA|nr:hypothetical protein Q7C36_023552 [Tachysurus vachellii]